MVASTSFPRGKKQSQAPAAAAPAAVATKPSKKRKHAGEDGEQDAALLKQAEDESAMNDVDALFGKKGLAQQQSGQATEAKKTKSKVRKQPSAADVKTQQKHDKDELASSTAHLLTFKTLTKGMLLFGCVRQINDTELMISLPNKLTGVVSKEEVSDEFFAYHEHNGAKKTSRSGDVSMDGEDEPLPALVEIFRVGQFVPCVVLSKSKEDRSKKLSLSLRVSRVHSELSPQSIAKGMTVYGTVSSVEDHGAIVNLGIRGLNAFAPMKELQNAGLTPLKGQLMLFSVLNVNAHTSTATLTPDHAQVVKTVTRGDSFTMNQLIPGMLLNVRVEEVLKNGLRVNFLTFFSATVEHNHMSNPCQLGWEELYRKGLKGRARIVSVDRGNKVVTLSMAPHVVYLSLPEPTFVVGDVIDGATIERIDAGIGMLLSLATGAKNAEEQDDDDESMEDEETSKKGINWQSFKPAYVHISNAADGHLEKLEKKFTVKNKVKCRVIGFAPFDGIVNVSCKESSLNQIVLRHKDLTPGLKVRATILAIESWGILLEISEGVRGVVAAQHVPPFIQLNKKKGAKQNAANGNKYTVGKQVEARVLRVDMDAKKTFLTMKKALLTASDDDVLGSFDDAKPGRVGTGYITKIAEYGVVVSFYNNVYGLVPAALLHQAGITNLEEAYVLGQVVRACVTRCDIMKQRLMLTFDLTGSATKARSSAALSEKSAANAKLVGTTIKNVKVLEIEATALRVQTEDGLEGVLPFVHLTDFPRQTALVDALVKRFEVGETIPGPVLVLSVANDGVLTLSKKPLLLQYVHSTKHIPRKFEQVKERTLVLGFVASVSATRGVFVRFLNNLTALAPKAFLSDKFVAEVEDGAFEMGETVLCDVEKLEKDKQQFIVGFRDYNRLVAGLSGMPSFVEAYLKEVASALEDDVSTAALALGATEKAEFIGLRPYGAVFTLENKGKSVTVIVPGVSKKTAAKWDEGDKKKVLLVDYDFEKHVYYGSVESELVESGSKKARKQKTRLAKNATVKNVRVIAVHSSYAIVAFADPQNKDIQQYGMLQVTDLWCPSRSCSSLELEVGSEVSSARVLAPALSALSDKKKTPFDALPLLAYEDEALLAALASKKKSKTTKEDSEHLPKYTNDDLKLGKLVTGRIIGIKEHSMEIKLKASSKCGKVFATVSIVDVNASDTEDEAHPFDRFNVNMVVQGRILAVVEKGANQRKPVSETNPANFHALSLSLRKQDVDSNKDVQTLVRADWQENSAGRALLAEGTAVEGVVVEQESNGLLVRLSHRVVAFVSAVELSKDVDELEAFRTHYPVGKRVRGWILRVDEEKKHIDLSLIHTSVASFTKTLKAGAVVTGMITTKVSVLKAPAVMVQLGMQTFGRACITELLPATQWKTKMLELPEFAHGQFVRCVVLATASSGSQIDLSLRTDALADPKAYVKAPLPTHAVGDLVTAVVASTTTSGCFLRINRDTLARVLLRDLSDEFIKNPMEAFPTGKLVAGRVTKTTEKGLEVSLKASIVSEDVTMVQWSDLHEGLTVKGTITKVQPYGVFVKIEKSNISGLCHISEVADERVTQALDQIFSEGDYVKAKILKIEDRRVSFSLKPSLFEGEPESSDEEEEDDESDAEDEEEAEDMEVEEEQPKRKVKDISETKAVSMDVDDEDDVPSSSDDEEESSSKAVEFTWDGFANVLDQNKSKKGDDSDDSDSDDEEDTGKKKKQHQNKQKKQTDEWIALREKALASNDERPQTADDYERLLAVNPQSSFLWIQYMAFHVSLTEIELARDVAKRATSTISFREEKEKLNVWVAYLNLEHDFGDDASFLRVFNSALRVNHQKRVYLQLVDIYARAEEHSDVETTLTTMQKKFRKSKQTWLRALQYYVAQSEMNKAAETLQRALKSVEAHKHLTIILKYGQLMFEHDELDKARTIFEGILSNYPKRMDLWNVYLDKEIKFGGDVVTVRALFERLLAMDFSAKKMKFLFKKYLQFEQTHGNDEHVAHVKQLAKDFVARAASSS
ncbi:hypothetical protein Poli38472_003555 [Pythium oligandrum]|uniref:S1 motif domain-containing protein n=1 Tax=Pythium oligandrum TaxID=41045 RepID=A0A8K1FBT9_PYTOL|nr:hypothetical protein Poli38472_003555 [Pythium oligandrum]|eukprot:TMW57630.1 hypothetical protein Poli38472_003555 [Pythium oligandrum]